MADPAAGRQAGGARRPVSPAAGVMTEKAALTLLNEGELEVVGQLVDASNTTLYCTVTCSGSRPPACTSQ